MNLEKLKRKTSLNPILTGCGCILETQHNKKLPISSATKTKGPTKHGNPGKMKMGKEK